MFQDARVNIFSNGVSFWGGNPAMHEESQVGHLLRDLCSLDLFIYFIHSEYLQTVTIIV